MSEGKKKKRRKKNDRAKAAAAAFAAIAIVFGASVVVLLGKINDAKLQKEADTDPGSGVGRSAVTELDDNSQAGENTADTVNDGVSAETDLSSADDGLPQTVLPGSENQKKFAPHAADLSDLRSELNEMMEYYPGDWSIYVQELKTGQSMYINNEQMYAASLIKLFAMGAVYQRISEEEVNEGYAYNSIYNMITISDNNAFDTVVDLMPEGYLNEWLMQNGFWDTSYVHGLGDDVVYEGQRSPDGDNFTTAKDVGKLLEKIYRDELVNKYYSEEMLAILKDQQKTSKIPAGLPEGTVFASKTGETDNVCHDSAIVYSDGGDYVIVVMCKALNQAWVCEPYVADISRTVYDYFNTLEDDDSEAEREPGISAEEYYDDEYDLDDEETADEDGYTYDYGEDWYDDGIY